jgi:hypothetical protein
MTDQPPNLEYIAAQNRMILHAIQDLRTSIVSLTTALHVTDVMLRREIRLARDVVLNATRDGES